MTTFPQIESLGRRGARFRPKSGLAQDQSFRHEDEIRRRDLAQGDRRLYPRLAGQSVRAGAIK